MTAVAKPKSNQKAELLSKTVEHIDITSFDARPIIDGMTNMSFTSRDLARATSIYNQMLADKDCSIILTLAGSTSAGGCMKLYADLIRFNMVDAIVATGASIVDMDFFEALGFKHYQAKDSVDDRQLRDLYIDRIYDTYIDEEELQACDHTILEIAKEFIVRRHKGQEHFAFENIPLDDAATYRLFQEGKTEAVFQFESRGMQGMLRDARPSRLEDLIALNALYRPGPMDLIPSFVARKHGKEKVEYPHPAVADMLSETYGIMVYQEQVMQSAQILGGYSLGGADLLRRAMGKKKAEEMAEHRVKFREGAFKTHGIPEQKADEIFDLMESFAGYGFNKSHAAAYSLLAYHTGWLKVHYTAEFFCANMTVEMDDTDKLKVLYEDALKFGITFDPPDVNRGTHRFEPVTDKVIRYGLGAIKGTGQQAIDAIKTNNTFKSIGISLRGGDRPSNDLLARAATRLTELTGDTVVPLEDDISKVTTKLFPQLQHQYGPLTEKLRGLNLPGVDRLQNLTHEINDVLLTDASDAPRRLGNEQSDLFDSLKWAAEVKLKLEQGLEQTLRDLRQHCTAIANLPNVALLATLKEELAEALSLIEERLQQADFYRFAADFSSSLTTIRARIRDTVIAMQDLLKTRIKEAEVDLKRVPEWVKLTQQEQTELLGDLERLIVDVAPDLAGLTTMLNKDYELQSQVQSLKHRIERLGQQRIKEELERAQDEVPPGETPEIKQPVARSIKARTKITTMDDLDALITQLQQLRGELKYAHAFAVNLELQDE